jgi:two-component system, LytTR family, sensor histidine kinase AlgZ
MHPLLTSRRLTLYLAAWVPLCALLAYATWASGRATWQDAAVSLGPACAVYAFICLSPWYICRARPLNLTNAADAILTFGAAAAAAGLALAGMVRLSASGFGQIASLKGLEQRIAPHLALFFAVGALLYLLSAGLHYAGIAAERTRYAEQRATEARSLARDAELHALRMQINPHFLFNSLNSISALATTDGVRAREMCARLAGFLRGSLSLGSRDTVPLSEELALARSYLEVEQVRFGARLRVVEEIGVECDACGVPALLLQPLVENAVKHGVAGLLEGGAIRLAVARDGSQVAVTIENAFDPDEPAAVKMGLGLAHVRRRLQVRYGDSAAMETSANDGVYRVALRFPCESPMASSSRA